MSVPVVFLAFSNDIESSLSLKRESRNIYQALSPLEDRRMIKIFREESATTSDIISVLERIGNPANDYQLVLFHFAGHADGKGIELIDGNGHASGLARLLAEFKDTLSLVFLNGCSTVEQVELLLGLGIKSVVATSAPVNDEQATLLAEPFYRKLASRSSIQQAFDFAASTLQFQRERQPQIKQLDLSRGIKLTEEAAAVEFPWVLYYDQNYSHVLEWQFKPPREVNLTRPYADQNIRPNEYLLDVAWEMGRQNPDIQARLDETDISDGEQFELIIKHFPWLISNQIQTLLSSSPAMSTPSTERLEQILSTYLTAGQLVYFILVSRLWDQKSRKKIGRIRLDVEETFGLTADTYLHFDYMAHAKQLIEEVQSHPAASLYIEEMASIKKSMDEKDDFHQAYLFLESKREQLLAGHTETLEQQIVAVCLDAEYALSVILCKLAFLVNFEMVTVRDIKLSKPRHKEVFYLHFIGKLHAYMANSILVSESPQRYAGKYLNDRSVILMRDLHEPEPFLNLTPFIIDRNAFSEKEDKASNLFCLGYGGTVNGKGEEYFYFVTSQNWLHLRQGPANDAHCLHTGMERKVDPRNRRRLRRGEKQLPFALLKEQILQMKADWNQ